jgi:hypothetical protein
MVMLGAAGGLIAAFVAWLFLVGPWRNADMNADPAAPLPPVLGAFDGEPPIAGFEAWRARRERLRAGLQQHIYGAVPAPVAPVIVDKRAIAPEHAGGVAGVEQWRVELGDAGRFHLAIMRPPGEAPAPLILTSISAAIARRFPAGRPRSPSPSATPSGIAARRRSIRRCARSSASTSTVRRSTTSPRAAMRWRCFMAAISSPITPTPDERRCRASRPPTPAP